MTTKRYLMPLLAAGLLLLSGCAAPYLHHDAMLSATTADLNGSQIDNHAVMLTVTVPFQSLLNPFDQTLSLDRKKSEPARQSTD